jgi:tRNA pseudouridine55 synthase
MRNGVKGGKVSNTRTSERSSPPGLPPEGIQVQYHPMKDSLKFGAEKFLHPQSRIPKRDVSGVLLLDKPKGLSSAGALTRVRGIFRAKKGGHAGSLDPLASGLLPILLGESAKFASFFLEGGKKYLAEGTLGVTTTTCDAEGEVVERRPVDGAQERLAETLKKFEGEITQIPPVYSAVKVGGRPLYKYARAGRDVEIPSRRVRIDSIRLVEQKDDRFTVEVSCSKGTYIRTLIADIGQALGCGAYVTMLRRIAVSGLPEGRMIGLEELQAMSDALEDPADLSKLDSLLLPTGALMSSLPKVELAGEKADRLMNGIRQSIREGCRCDQLSMDPSEHVSIWGRGCFMGVGHIQGHLLVPDRMMSDPFAAVRESKA